MNVKVLDIITGGLKPVQPVQTPESGKDNTMTFAIVGVVVLVVILASLYLFTKKN